MEPVIVTKEYNTITLTLNRPEKRNALNSQVIQSLISLLREYGNQDDVSAIFITGSGDKAFCSGADLAGFPEGDSFLSIHQSRGKFSELLTTIDEIRTPVIALVNGDAYAGALGIISACDMAVSVDTAVFGTPEIKRGLFPMMIMTSLFRTMNYKKVMEMILLGEKFSAALAKEFGLLNAIFPKEHFDKESNELKKKFSLLSPAILKLGRNAAHRQKDMSYKEALTYLHTMLTVNSLTDDAAEGISAFLEKREPNWKSK